MAVNENGYVRPTYDELLELRIVQAQELFGENIDTSDASPLGKFIRLAVQDLADAYEAQEIIYYARFPHTATGQSLDRLMPFAGISRNPATRAQHEIQFTGTAGHTIESGFLVGTTGDEEFYLISDLTLDENGDGVGIVECAEAGTIGNVTLGSITEIVNPDANVSGIAHTGIEAIGTDEESDTELRERFEVAISGSGSATADAIKGAVMRVTGVRGCLVIENDSDAAVDGVPAHSFETYVHSDDSSDQQVAEAIFSKKPLGIKTHGDVSVSVVDASGNAQTVKFSRVAETAIYVKVSITKDTHFELDGVEQIKTALIEYVGGLLAGDDVILSNMYRYIFGVAGVVDVTSLTLSSDGSTYNAANIPIGVGSVATLSADNIEVTVV